MCVFEYNGKTLAAKGNDKAKGEIFYRVLGGGLNFDESAENGVRREIKEELDCEVENLKLIDVFENRYTYGGVRGHDVIFLYTGALSNKSLYQRESIHIVEEDYELDAEWVPIDQVLSGKIILYPEFNYSRIFE